MTLVPGDFFLSDLTRYLTRFAIQAKGPDGKWTWKPLAYRESISVHLRVTVSFDMCPTCF